VPFIMGAVAALVAVAGVYPAAPTQLEYRVRDSAGRTVGNALVKSEGRRVRIEAFGATFLYDGTTWFAEGLEPEASPALALTALLTPGSDVRTDGAGRPLLLRGVPAGSRTARIEARYDDSGLAIANIVFSDGAGFQFRRISAEPASFSESDFEPPRRVAAPPPAPERERAATGPDYAAVARLLSLQITESEEREFERGGSIGRYRGQPQ
jgi:hypothetical protein